jgi:hypothetical protein
LQATGCFTDETLMERTFCASSGSAVGTGKPAALRRLLRAMLTGEELRRALERTQV